MALFRYSTGKDNFYVELGWEGMSYSNSPIHLAITQKDQSGTFNKIEEFPAITYDKTQSKTGYTFKSSLGDLTVKWGTVFWIISVIQVFLNGSKLDGGEIINIEGVTSGKYV